MGKLKIRKPFKEIIFDSLSFKYNNREPLIIKDLKLTKNVDFSLFQSSCR